MGNKRDHTSVMDLLTSPYSDFIMDDREMLFHSIAGQVSSFHDDSLTLMSAELIPRLEGGIRAVLDEAANL